MNDKISFENMVFSCAGFNANDRFDPEALARLPYEKERAIRETTLKKFLNERIGKFCSKNILDEISIVPAVMPRNYRANSKRKIIFRRGKAYLVHSGGGNANGASLLEDPLHGKIYSFLEKFFNHPLNKDAAQSVNFCTVKTSCAKAALIVSVAKTDGNVVRMMKHLSANAVKAFPELDSVWLYAAPETKYYMESRVRPEHALCQKKLCGKNSLFVQVNDDLRLGFSPLGFSQINEKMTCEFVNTAKTLLAPDRDCRLIDLYCGYGLIGLAMANDVKELIGMEIDENSFNAAELNKMHSFPDKAIRFIRRPVTEETLSSALPPPLKDWKEIIVLDPPRAGTGKDVIKTVAARKAAKILHVFCGTDAVPSSVSEWHGNGYKVKKIVPVDMFPGTASVETFILLER